MNNNNHESLTDIEDVTIESCEGCSVPCSTHQVYPSYLKINQELPLQGTVKPFSKHVLISTGKIDWQAHIEDEHESLASHLAKVINVTNGSDQKKNETIDKGSKKPKILITNSNRKNGDYDPLISNGDDVLLFPDNIIIRHVSPKHAAEFRNQFLCNKFGRGDDDLIQKNPSPTLPVTFTVEKMLYKSVILICSHKRRDKRCGVTAPLLKDEFDKVLKNKGLDVDSRVDNKDGIAVYMTSHIGGHKFAGNVIVYCEGKGIWYGRVTPCHVNLIIEKTVIEGRIIRDLYRGGFVQALVSPTPLWNQNLIESRASEPKTNTFNLVLKKVNLAPDGFTRIMSTINGQYPGPTIEVNKGDRIVMNIRNELEDPTSIHAHGIFQKGTPWFDGVPGQTQCEIPSDYEFTYNFTVPDQVGTYWYHSHDLMQYVDGIVGALIIHDPDDPYKAEYDEEILVMLTDYHHTEAQILLNSFLTPERDVPDNGLINGKNNYDCSKAPPGSTCVDNAGLAKFEFVSNKRYRLRIINTSAFSAFFFSIDKHVMEVIEVEGTYTKRNKIHRLPINVGQRYSVIVTADQSVDNYIMRSEFQKKCMPDGAISLPVVTAIVHYDGAPEDSVPKDIPWTDFLEECIDLIPETLQPLYEEKVPEATREIIHEIAFHKDSLGIDKAFINGSTYVPNLISSTLTKVFEGTTANLPASENAFTFNTFGEVVDIYFINTDEGEHPIHMHGHQFWLLGIGNGTVVDKTALNTVNPIKRDTSTIPISGWSALRFVVDNPGVWGHHCHMWHMQVGLVMQLIELPDEINKLSPPEEWAELCQLKRY
ncbi:1010_t:CDS:10 [Funneliformis geosporum]|uniref:1010_t:CDS:1 n=1 Tax=Funneliformis geosporum TaxID=1117311 RepID=A0A9W4SLH2_9GLOM|nr:1010_t:CDS:10 [Funneliformis geosporum]